MKRLLSAFIVLAFMFLPGCSSEPRFTDFDRYASDFTAVADFLTNYYANNQFSDPMTVDFTDGTMFLYVNPLGVDKTAISANDLFQAVSTVESHGFGYAWVTQDYIIFWEDETKYYGLLHAQSPRKAISEIRQWYKGMDSAKINNEWYEIGALNSI